MTNSALILINLQIDYCPGGAMEVSKGDELIPIANDLMSNFEWIYAAIDLHPANHVSFAGNHPWRLIGQSMEINGIKQELFPFHCVENSFGANFYPGLASESIDKVFYKGTDARWDNYSCFFDINRKRDTGLFAELQEKNIEQLFIMGLATEKGILHAALDGLDLGFKIFVISDACRSENKLQGAEKMALKKIIAAGGSVIQIQHLT